MTKLAPEWVRTSDPVIRSPARYRWTTAPAFDYRVTSPREGVRRHEISAEITQGNPRTFPKMSARQKETENSDETNTKFG